MILKYLESKYAYNQKLILFTLFIFFFDLGFDDLEVLGIKFDFLDARYLLLLILPIFFYDFFLMIKKKSINFIFFSLLLIIPIHILILNYIKLIDYNFISLSKLFLSIIYISIIIFYRDFILKNIIRIINLFLIFYFVLILTNSFLNYYNNETLCLVGCFSENREIFKEASHLAFISPLIIIFYLNVVEINKLKLIYKFLIIFFFISILNNLSTTLLGTIIIPSVLILITNYKSLINKKKLIIVIIFFTLLILFDRNTLVKINQFYDISRIIDNKSITPIIDNKSITQIIDNKSTTQIIDNKSTTPIIDNKSITQIIDNISITQIIDNKATNFLFKKEDILKSKKKIKSIDSPGKLKNLSIETLIANTKLAIYSLKNDYIGWGLHNYKYAHQAYISKVNNSNVKGTMWLNSQDGTNNFNKGIVEFGFIFFVPILMIIFLLFDKKISINNKLLIFPILFSQTFIRGSGFFNGGYVVFLIILMSIYYTNYKGTKK